VYSNTAKATSDISRNQYTDPLASSGVIAEVITTGAQTLSLTPAVVGFNDENPVSNIIPITITNLSGSSAAITVTLTLLQTET
jgi:hypothetical protein